MPLTSRASDLATTSDPGHRVSEPAERSSQFFDAAADALDPKGVFINPRTAFDAVLDADARDCVLDRSLCYVCEVQGDHTEGWRV